MLALGIESPGVSKTRRLKAESVTTRFLPVNAIPRTELAPRSNPATATGAAGLETSSTCISHCAGQVVPAIELKNPRYRCLLASSISAAWLVAVKSYMPVTNAGAVGSLILKIRSVQFIPVVGTQVPVVFGNPN